MTFIFAQRGATTWGFQIGRAYLEVMYPRYWLLRFPRNLVRWGLENNRPEREED